jgi:hypothetical protein
VILEVPKQFVDDLTAAGKLVRYVDKDPQKLFPVPSITKQSADDVYWKGPAAFAHSCEPLVYLASGGVGQ